MAKAVKCPICDGRGGFIPDTNLPCNGCSGKGWVEVAEDLLPYSPPQPFFGPYYPSPQYPGYFYPPGPWCGAVIGNMGGNNA